MAISDREARRLNYSMPVAQDIKLGDIIQTLQEADGGDGVTWDTLAGKPSEFPPENHTHNIADVNGLQTELNTKLESVAWGDVGGKPSEFPPASHTHSIADVSGLQGELDGKLSSVTAGDVDVTAIPDATGSNVQEVLADLAARIAALEAGGGE